MCCWIWFANILLRILYPWSQWVSICRYFIVSLPCFVIKVMLGPSGSVLSSSIFWNRLCRISVIYSLKFLANLSVKHVGDFSFFNSWRTINMIYEILGKFWLLVRSFVLVHFIIRSAVHLELTSVYDCRWESNFIFPRYVSLIDLSPFILNYYDLPLLQRHLCHKSSLLLVSQICSIGLPVCLGH